MACDLKIILDAGHGGVDPGAIGQFNLKESHITLYVVSELKRIFDLKGITTILTRNSDITVPVNDRWKLSNKYMPDLFLSIHCNADTNPICKGIEVLVKAPNTKSEEIAKCVSNSVVEWTKDKDRGIKYRDNVGVLDYNKAPAILVEIGFISNKDTAQKMLDIKYLQGIAESIVNGVLGYFNKLNK